MERTRSIDQARRARRNLKTGSSAALRRVASLSRIFCGQTCRLAARIVALSFIIATLGHVTPIGLRAVIGSCGPGRPDYVLLPAMAIFERSPRPGARGPFTPSH